MYFSNDVVQVNLDNSFLAFPDTAHEHVIALFDEAGIPPRFYEPKKFHRVHAAGHIQSVRLYVFSTFNQWSVIQNRTGPSGSQGSADDKAGHLSYPDCKPRVQGMEKYIRFFSAVHPMP